MRTVGVRVPDELRERMRLTKAVAPAIPPVNP
jgi:hypothetical protein